MAMYIFGNILLIHELSTPIIYNRQIWYADDASAAGSLSDLLLIICQLNYFCDTETPTIVALYETECMEIMGVTFSLVFLHVIS